MLHNRVSSLLRRSYVRFCLQKEIDEADTGKRNSPSFSRTRTSYHPINENLFGKDAQDEIQQGNRPRVRERFVSPVEKKKEKNGYTCAQ